MERNERTLAAIRTARNEGYGLKMALDAYKRDEFWGRRDLQKAIREFDFAMTAIERSKSDDTTPMLSTRPATALIRDVGSIMVDSDVAAMRVQDWMEMNLSTLNDDRREADPDYAAAEVGAAVAGLAIELIGGFMERRRERKAAAPTREPRVPMSQRMREQARANASK
jgi:hypothetical protein